MTDNTEKMLSYYIEKANYLQMNYTDVSEITKTDSEILQYTKQAGMSLTQYAKAL